MRPDYTIGGDVANILPTLMTTPADRELRAIVAQILADSFRDNPGLPVWYRLPIVALAADIVSAFARSHFYRAVPNEPTAEKNPVYVPGGLTDDHRKLLLRQWLLRKVPGTVAVEQVMPVVDATFTLWAEADGATEECWTKLVQVVQQAVELGLAAASE